MQWPTVVNVDSIVACFEKTFGDHSVCGPSEERLIEVTFKARPVLKAHMGGVGINAREASTATEAVKVRKIC